MERLAAAVVFLITTVPCLADAGVVWWEAEEFAESNWPGGKTGRGAFAPQNDDERSKLSAGTWLNVAGKRSEALYAEYDITVSADDTYDFYVRKFWHHGPFRYRWDDEAWTNVRGRLGFLDSTPLRKHVVANWIRLQPVTLKAGKHKLRMELLENDGAAAFDAFVLARGLFLPRGTHKPDEKTGLADPGTWAFEPGIDPFDEDRRMLNAGKLLGQQPIGPDDWITARGHQFIAPDGKPFRLWGMTIGTHNLGLRELQYQARRLATLGVNHVRVHEHFQATGPDARLTDINEDLLAGLHRTVAAMRESGIYTKLSPYYVLPCSLHRNWGITPWPTDTSGKPLPTWDKPFGLLFFDETLQDGYKAWLREILTRPNPHTGVPLAKDPALYMLQIQNEDSFFFWTFLKNIPAGQQRKLGQKFGAWLTGKYGSLEKALAAWGGEDARLHKAEGVAALADDFDDRVAGLLTAWAMTLQYKNASHQKRLADQVQFLAETQHAFNAEIARYVRDELGYRGLISPNNWRTADSIALLDAERWTYTAGDVIDMHHYFAATHVNPSQGHRAGYTIDKGDRFVNASALRQPRRLPINYRQHAARPNIISEFTWVQPNRLQADGPLVMAAYGALADIDGLFWFASGSVDYDPTITKFQVNTPPLMGQFPATALLYRAGLVDTAEAVVSEQRPLNDLWQRKPPLIAEDPGYDPNRDAAEHDATAPLSVDPLAYLVGRVEADYVKGQPAKSSVAPIGKFVNRQAEIVTSSTGQVTLNYGRGILAVNAPQAQGAAGFLSNADSRELADVTIDCRNSYAAILVVSLDGKPIATSKRLLVQAATEARPHGWRTTEKAFTAGKTRVEGQEILDLGGGPWNVVNTDASVTIRNPHLSKATPLDAHGYPKPTAKAEFTRAGKAIHLRLPANAMYTILE